MNKKEKFTRKPIKKRTSSTWKSFCDPGGIQTHDLQNRNLTLYSAKLPSQRQRKSIYNLAGKQMNGQKKITFDILQATYRQSLPFCK